MAIIYFNGRWLPLNRAGVSPLDRGFLYGDGVFETIRAYHGTLFQIGAHLRRFYRSARLISLKIPESGPSLETIARQVLKKNHLKNAMVRLTCSRGVNLFGLDLPANAEPTLILMAFPLIPIDQSGYQKGIKVRIVSSVRTLSDQILARVKSNNALAHILARLEAKKSGADEGILLNEKGFLTEGTVSNLFLVRNGKLLTPSEDSGILAGITRNVVISLAKKVPVPVVETRIRPQILVRADECFVTNSRIEIMPVCQINDRPVGSGKPGAITNSLMNLFKRKVISGNK